MNKIYETLLQHLNMLNSKIGGFIAALLYWSVLALSVVFSVNPSHQEKH